jgi:DNA-binding FadR family transcriptional regulator
MLQPHPSRQLLAQVNAPSTVSRRRLHGSIAHDLAVDIVAGTLKPGDVLPNEDQISERLQVSRTAYREGVRTLVAKGLVETRPKTGTRVTDRSHWNMLDPDVLSWHFEVEPRVEFVTSLFELRRVVEPGAAALAAQRRTDEDLAAMADALERMGQVTTGTVDGLEADLAFHHAILVATRNEPLIALSSAIGSTMRWSVRLTLTNNPQAHRDSLPEHQAVQRAIAAGDSAKAQKTMSLLVDHALEDTLHAFQRLVSRRHKR